jgi:hypothetical protein
MPMHDGGEGAADSGHSGARRLRPRQRDYFFVLPSCGAGSGGGGSYDVMRVVTTSVRALEWKVNFDRTGIPRVSEKSTSQRNSGE